MTDRLLTRAFVALTLSDLAYFTGGGVLIFATPLFVTGPLGSDEAAVGLVMGAFSVTTLLLRPWIGRWVDRHGRRTLLIGGALAFAIVALGHLLVTSVAGVVVVRMLLGAAEACYFVAGFAALADLAPPARAGEALSLNSLALYLGIGVGPLVGQVLVATGGYPAAWWGAAALAAVGALLLIPVPETYGGHDVDAPPSPLVNPATLLPGLALASGILVMSGFMAFAVLVSRDVGARPWSLALVLFGGTVVSCRLVFAKLPDRVEPSRLIVTALLTSSVGMLVIGVAPSAGTLLPGAVVCGLGSAFLTPAVFGLVFRSVPAGERGSAAASLSLFIDLALSGGPMMLGFTAVAVGLPGAFVLASVVPAAGAGVVWLTRHRRAAVAP